VDYGYYPLIHLISEFEKKECYMECSYIKKALDISIEELKSSGILAASYQIPTTKIEYLEMVKDKKWPFNEEKENNKIKLIKEKLENVL
tara:strand:+ start:2721 stop:2987 length:267 start_codon:yes stop_codon:yes gene_type:complete